MQFILHNELTNMIRLSQSQILRLEKKGKFPNRIRLGHRTVVWDKDEINSWIEERKEASHG